MADQVAEEMKPMAEDHTTQPTAASPTAPGRPGNGQPGGTDERSLAELVKALTEQTSRLARQEVELAKAEMTAKGRKLGVGAGEFGAAGLLGLGAFAALTATFILALAEAVDGWLAALIVTVVYAAIAAALAMAGRNKVQEGSPVAPEQAMASSRQDMETVKERAKEGRA
jgi:hypothetical protein